MGQQGISESYSVRNTEGSPVQKERYLEIAQPKIKV